jgi:hypothetical protein
VQDEFAKNWLLDVSYVGLTGRKFYVNNQSLLWQVHHTQVTRRQDVNPGDNVILYTGVGVNTRNPRTDGGSNLVNRRKKGLVRSDG